MAINRYEKEEKRNQQDSARKKNSASAPQSVGRVPVKYIKVNAAQAKKNYDNGLTIATKNSSGGYNYYQKNNKPAISSYTKAENINQKKTDTIYSYSNKKTDEMTLAEYTAYLRNNPNTKPEDYTNLAKAIEDPSHRFYNPYWGKRVVQSGAAEAFLREYFGGYTGDFDANFFEQTSFLAQYELRDGNTSLSIQSPGSKGTMDQWAAYYRIQLQNDMSKQQKVDEEWNALRTQMQSVYDQYKVVYNRDPSYEELMNNIDMSDYGSLIDIDDSRNLDWNTSHAPVELNNGTYYMKESLLGVYQTLKNGGDVTEDRDYFEDAVQYYMQPSEKKIQENALQKLGFDASGWAEKDYAAQMQAARKAGDHEAYETLKRFQWQNSTHMESVDTADYLGERFGYYKDDKYFSNIEAVFAPIWNEMYTDSSKTSIKKPNSSDSMIYHAAYQAWEDMQLKEDTELVEAQAEKLYKSIDNVDKNGFESEAEYTEFIRDYLIDSNSEEYKELNQYMEGKLVTARDIFISEEELNDYISKAWNGTKKEIVIPKASEAPIGYDKAISEKAADDAAKQKTGIDRIAAALVGLFESGASVSATQFTESGLAIAPVEIIESESASGTLSGLWLATYGQRHAGLIGEDAGQAQRSAIDPVYKMLVGATASDGTQGVTLAGINELLVRQSAAHMAGNGLSIADGVIRAAIPDAEMLMGAIDRLQENAGAANLALLHEQFDINTYNRLYGGNVDAGYTLEDAAEAALNATLFCTPGLRKIGLGLEENEALSAAAARLNEKIMNADGFGDSAGFVGSIAEKIIKSEKDSSEEVKEISAAMIIGMSEQATPAHAAMTKDIINEIASGDITSKDVVDGVKNSAKNLAATILATDSASKIDVTAANIITTKHYDALDDETKAAMDGMYNQGISNYVSQNEIMDGISEYTVNADASRKSQAKSKAADTGWEKFVTNTDFVAWLGAVTGLNSDETNEQYMVKNDLLNYGKWFTFDEAYELARAWENGTITYDGFRAILEKRVAQYSLETVNAMRNGVKLADGSAQAHATLDQIDSDIRGKMESGDSGIDDAIIAAANNAVAAIHTFADPVSIVERDETLRAAIDYDGLVQKFGDDEMALSDAITSKLVEITNSSKEIDTMNPVSGNDYTLPQIDELRKLLKLYDCFGVYGYDFIACATPELLKKCEIDFEKVGLSGSAEEYMDELTAGAWRDAYMSDGLGFVGTVNAGLLGGVQAIGNLPAKASRLIRDVLDFLPGVTAYEEGDGSYYDHVQAVSGKLDERLASRATSFESFCAQVINEFARNQITGIIGASLGAIADSGKYTKGVSAAIAAAKGSEGVVNVQGVLQLANTATIAGRAIDSAEIIARMPFASSVFLNSYEEHKDAGRSLFSSIMRSSYETLIELFTETPAVDNKLNAIRSRVLPGLENASDGAIAYAARIGGDIFNEVGQEEISMLLNRACDVSEAIDTSKIADVSSFFKETWSAIQKGTDGMGAEAGSTALSTACITLLGAIVDLPIEAISRRRFREYQMSGTTMTANEFETLLNTTIVEYAQHIEDADDETDVKSADNYDPSMTPVFDRHRKTIDAIKGALKGEVIEADLIQAIEEDIYPAEATNLIENDNPDSEGLEELSTDAFDMRTSANDIRLQPDPNLSIGAQKVADYMNEAENGERDAVVAEVGNRVIEEGMANDPTIKSAEKNVSVAQEKLGKEQEAEQSIAQEIDAKKAQLGKVFEAAANECVDFNSAAVQNAVIANQQATAALESDFGKQQEKTQEAADNLRRAEETLEETKEAAIRELQSEAQKAKDEARIEYEKAKRILDSASKKQSMQQGLFSAEEISEKKYKNNDNQSATTSSDRDVDRRTVNTEDDPWDEEPKQVNKTTGADLSKITILPDEEGRFDFDDYAGREYEAVYGVLKKDVPREESSETAGIDDRDYGTDFNLRAKTIADLFNDILDMSNTEDLQYFVNLPKEQYGKLRGIFERIGDDGLLNAFFKRKVKTDKDADQRWYDRRNRGDKTIDLVKSLSSSHHALLNDEYGMVPVRESNDEIILEVKDLSDRLKSDELFRAEEALKAANQEAVDFAIAIGTLNDQLNTCDSSQKPLIVRAIQEAQKLKDEVDANAEAARQNLVKVQQMQNGIVSEKFVAIKKADLQAAISNATIHDIISDIDVSVQEEKLWEQYDAGVYTTEDLREILIDNTDFSGMDEHTAELVRSNIGGMTDVELLTEIVAAWREADIEDNAEGLLNTVPHTAFSNKSEMKAYVKEHGGLASSGGVYQNLDAEDSYYVFGGLLALAHQYAVKRSEHTDIYGPLPLSGDSDHVVRSENAVRVPSARESSQWKPERNETLELSIMRLANGDLETFFQKLVDLANRVKTPLDREKALEALGIEIAPPLNKGKIYAAVDTVAFGTLLVNAKCENSELLDSNDNFVIERATEIAKKACEAISNSKRTGEKTDYTVRVVTNENGKRVVYTYGYFYNETGGRYMPTYASIMENADEIFVTRFATNENGKKYPDLDFSIKTKDVRSDDALKNSLDEAERLLRGLFSGSAQPSVKDFKTYATAYLEAKRDIITRELNQKVRDYRLNGVAAQEDTITQLGADVSALQSELTQINRALQNTKALDKYTGAYNFNGTGTDKESLTAAIEDTLSKVGAESAEAQAAVALLESTAETQGNAEEQKSESTRIKRRVAYEVSKRLRDKRKVQKDAATSTFESKESDSSEIEPETTTAIDGIEPADAEMAEANSTEEMDEMLVQAMEDYEIDPKDEAAINEAYPERNVSEPLEEGVEPADAEMAEGDHSEVDENTYLGTLNHTAEAVEYGKEVLRKMKPFIQNLQKQINELTSKMKTEQMNGAGYWDALEKELAELTQKLKDAEGNPAKHMALQQRINKIYDAMEKNRDCEATYKKWSKLKAQRQVLENRRNTAKQNYKRNAKIVYGTEFSKNLARNEVQYDPYARISGSKGNKTGVQIAKELLDEAKKGKILKYDNKTVVQIAKELLDETKNGKVLKYGKKTALTIKQVAELLQDKLEPSFYETIKEDLKVITATRRDMEKSQAQYRYRMACIDAALGRGDTEAALDDLIAAYQEGIKRTSFTEGGYMNYKDALKNAKKQALEDAQRISDEYAADKDERSLEREKTELTYRIEDDEKALANIISSERSYYQLGNGDVEAALSGEKGGAIPVPLMNIFTGMIVNAANENKGAGVVTREMDSTQRIVDAYLGDYAPFINAVFINPALRAADAQRAENNRIQKELDKKLSGQKIEVTVAEGNETVTKKMSIREIVGHIIDERNIGKYSSYRDDDYIQQRLLEYGITDADMRKRIVDAVEYGRQLNDELYTRANSELVKNGHHKQTYDYRKWYMHHYNNDGDDARLRLFGIHTGDYEISQVFIDETGNRRPSHEFNAAAFERHGNATGYDFVESVQRSLSGVLNTIYQTGNIDRLKQLEQAISGTPKLDEKGNYVYENNKVVLESKPIFSVNAKGEVVNKNHYIRLGNIIGQFAQRAANKQTGQFDRAIMNSLGRKSIGWLRFATSIKSANAVAFNFASAVTNVVPVKFLIGICNVCDIISAMANTVTQLTGMNKEEDYIAANSNYVKGRSTYSAEERSIQGKFGKIIDAGFAPAEFFDTITVNFMARALFNHEIRTNGGNAEAALVQTEDMLRRMLTDKSRVGRSQFYENMSLGGFFGQFQQESVNELMYMMKDMKYYGGGKIPRALAMMVAVYIINGLFNFWRGTESMSDPAGELVKAFNDFDENATGYEKFKAGFSALSNTIVPIDFLKGDGTAVTNTIKDVADAFGGLFSGEEDVWDFLATLCFCSVPGGTSAKRTITGVKSVNQGYAETNSGRMKFLTNNTWQDYLTAALFGVNGLKESKAYNYGFESALGSDQSDAFKQLVEGGLDREAAVKYVKAPNEASYKEQYDVDKALENTSFKPEMEDLGDEAMNADYERLYNMHMKAYTRGDYGKVGSTKAREKLEKALQSAKARVKEKHQTSKEVE